MRFAALTLVLLGLFGCGRQEGAEAANSKNQVEPGAGPHLADEATLDRYLAQYAPYSMNFDGSALPDREKQLLQKLVEAARVVDRLYWEQTSAAGQAYRAQLEGRGDAPSR